MSSKVLGADYTLYFYRNGAWRQFACARSGSFTMNTDFIETTGPGDGNYKSFKATVHGFTGQLDGACALDTGSDLSEADLLSLQMAKTKVLCRFEQTAQNGDIYTKEAYFYISSYTDTGSFDGIATFQVQLQGTGALTIVYDQPPAPAGSEMRYPEQGDTAPATTGAYTWTATGLGNKYITGVYKDGRGRSNIITSGTPVGNEVLYETSGSDAVFTFPEPFEDGETPPYATYRDL
mgnify:FL=1